MAEQNIRAQIEAWYELASRINERFLGLCGRWPEGRQYVHLPYQIDNSLEELRTKAGSSFYVEGGELGFISVCEMDRDASRNYKEALCSLMQSCEESGDSITRIEALLEKLS